MTTAFLAEVDTPQGTRYIAKKGKLSKVPHFFTRASTLKEIFSKKSYYSSTSHYSLIQHREQTRVCIVKDLEKGLRSSTGGNISVAEFVALDLTSSGQYAPKKPGNAVFKIQLPRVYSGRGPKAIQFAGGGKFGKTWEHQGHVRLHLNNNLDRMLNYYKGAEVVMIEMEPDGFTPYKVSRTPIIDWYIQSPKAKLRWDELTRLSIINAPDKVTRSEYA